MRSNLERSTRLVESRESFLDTIPRFQNFSLIEWSEFKRELELLGPTSSQSFVYRWTCPATELAKVIGTTLLGVSDPVILATLDSSIRTLAKEFAKRGARFLRHTSVSSGSSCEHSDNRHKFCHSAFSWPPQRFDARIRRIGASP